MQNGAVSIYAGNFVASAAIAANRFVGANGAPAAAGGNTIGVARFDGVAGDLITRDVLGTAIVEAGGAITAFGAVEVGADGKAVAHAEGIAVGRLEGNAALADGDFVEVLLFPN